MPHNFAIFGKPDEATINQMEAVAANAVRAALMGDSHVGFVMPIGGVAAYNDMVSIMGVGVDIACGNCAIKLDTKLEDLGKSQVKQHFMLNRIADDIASTISFGMGRNNKAKDAPDQYHWIFESEAWSTLKERAGHGLARQLHDKAKNQLGTVGGGNHYVDVFADEDGHIWIGVHFGSRGLGHGIAMGFNTLAAGGIWGDRTQEHEGLISLKSTLGQDYWQLMELAGQYAYAGREWVAKKTAEIIGGKALDMVHNNHNFAWKEKHIAPSAPGADDLEIREVVVVRKGATPAWPGQRGFVGGSMGDNSVILKGKEYGSIFAPRFISQENTLFSTVHGAGRVMSRTEAKGKTDRKTGKLKLDKDGNPIKVGKITQDMMDSWVNSMGVIRRGGDLDEAPQAYRRLPEVLAQQGDTIEVEHILTPLIVVMADKNIVDPYKD